MYSPDLQSREKEIKIKIEKEDWKAGMWNARSDVKERNLT